MEDFKKFVGIITFEAETPLHIGGTRESNVLYMLKLPDGKLIIPSTSWKGAFRSIAEKLAPSISMSEVERLAVNHLIENEDLSEYIQMFKDALENSEGFLGGNNVREVLRLLGYKKDEVEERKEKNLQELLENYLAFHCPIGKLFGNHVWASRIRFCDTILPLNYMERRTGIGIDRSRGVAKSGVLYFIETTEVGVDIPLIIMGEIYKDTATRIFALTLEFIKDFGLSIGARKSVGLGTLTIKDAKFYVVNLSEDDGGVLLANPFKVKPIDIDSFIKLLKSC